MDVEANMDIKIQSNLNGKAKQPLTVLLCLAAFFTLFSGCNASRIPEPSTAHLKKSTMPMPLIPPSISKTSVLPKPSKPKKVETYTVVVDSVPVRELLFSMARDANLNLDIDNDIEGTVTLNAVNQTLLQILDRISELVPIRYSIDTGQLRIRRDDPYLKAYRIDYLNMGRLTSSQVRVSTQIAATGEGANDEGGAGSDSVNNNSETVVENTSDHTFWDTLISNIDSIISVEEITNSEDEEESDEEEEAPEASGSAEEESAYDEENIIVNKESGIIAVRATRSQHKDIQAFLDEVLNAIQRQVLIEATIAEVTLNDTYKAGIDWSALQRNGNTSLTDSSNPTGINLMQNLSGVELGTGPAFLLKLTETDIGGNRVDLTLKALEVFGEVQIMSSPKIMALNNQTAILKVVDNLVYFTIEVDSTTSTAGTSTAFSTEIHTVPVGFVMAVTPFIDEYSSVTLNVRPTISRLIGTVQDPNPSLAANNVSSEVPVIQVREVESILKVDSGDTAIIGGLMQDDINKTENSIPLLSKIPYIGDAFSFKSDEYVKTELVIFIRPVVINQASLKKDLKEFSNSLSRHMK